MDKIKFEVGKFYCSFGEKFLVYSRTDEKIRFRKSDGKFFTVKILKNSSETEFVRIPGKHLCSVEISTLISALIGKIE